MCSDERTGCRWKQMCENVTKTTGPALTWIIQTKFRPKGPVSSEATKELGPIQGRVQFTCHISTEYLESKVYHTLINITCLAFAQAISWASTVIFSFSQNLHSLKFPSLKAPSKYYCLLLCQAEIHSSPLYLYTLDLSCNLDKQFSNSTGQHNHGRWRGGV